MIMKQQDKWSITLVCCSAFISPCHDFCLGTLSYTRFHMDILLSRLKKKKQYQKLVYL